jgi:peptide/nickel transport system substrate-binding protein
MKRKQAVPKAQFFKKLEQLESRFYLLGWEGAETDAQPTLETLMHSFNVVTGQGTDNYGRFQNTEMDAMIERAAHTTDSQQRQRWIAKALQIHTDQIYHLLLYRQKLTWVSKANIKTVLGGNNHFRAWLTDVQALH